MVRRDGLLGGEQGYKTHRVELETIFPSDPAFVTKKPKASETENVILPVSGYLLP